MYVHGWVATLADLLVVGIGLALAHALVTRRTRWRRAHPGFGLARGEALVIDPQARWTAGATATTAAVPIPATALALPAKEAALAFPAQLALCWALRPGERWLGAATAGAALAAGVYLALRAPVLLAGGDAAYAVDPAWMPRQWLAYHLFVLRPSTFEVAGLWNASSVALGVAAVLWLGLWTVVLRADRRLGVALVVGGTLALAPTLPIPLAANHYGYAFSAWCVACVALAWPRLRFGARVFAWFFLVVVLWHGANVQREMRRAGERQALFMPALVAALATHRGPLDLYAPDRPWLYRRLTTGVAAWDGHRIGDRVRWVDSREAADLVVAENGQLAPP